MPGHPAHRAAPAARPPPDRSGKPSIPSRPTDRTFRALNTAIMGAIEGGGRGIVAITMARVTPMRVGLAQVAPRLGAVDENVATHLEWVERARAERVDLLVFPELGLTGY